MKKNRIIFYAVFAVFHLFLVFFTFYIDSNKNDISFLSSILRWMSILKYGAFLGLILLIIDLVWASMNNRETQREKDVLTSELNTLKAKLFDLQESSRTGSGSSKTNINS
jgi:hypothetical protein